MIICKCQMISNVRVPGCHDTSVVQQHVVKRYLKLFKTDNEMYDYIKHSNHENNKFNMHIDCQKLDTIEKLGVITMEDCKNNTLPELMEIFDLMKVRKGEKKLFSE